MTTGRLSRSGNERVKLIEFDKDTLDGSVIKQIPANARVREVSVVIDTPFDVLTTISVGTPAENEKYLAEADNNPLAAGEYTVFPNDEEASVSDIRLYINPGASTQGSGTAYIYYI